MRTRPFVALLHAVRAGDLARAQALQAAITHVWELVEGSLTRRPATSTLFHILDYALRARGVCENILLAHEGTCPDWLAENARSAMRALDEACTL